MRDFVKKKLRRRKKKMPRAGLARAGLAQKARTAFGSDGDVEFDDETLRAALTANKDDICAGNFVITRWRVGKVTNMRGLFRDWDTFDQRLEWDVGRVTDMAWMFSGCRAFNQPIRSTTGGEWDVSSVTSMLLMFCDCATFDQELRWESKRCRNFRSMFSACHKLTRTIHLDAGAVEKASMLDGIFAEAANLRLVLTNVPEGLGELSNERRVPREPRHVGRSERRCDGQHVRRLGGRRQRHRRVGHAEPANGEKDVLRRDEHPPRVRLVAVERVPARRARLHVPAVEHRPRRLSRVGASSRRRGAPRGRRRTKLPAGNASHVASGVGTACRAGSSPHDLKGKPRTRLDFF